MVCVNGDGWVRWGVSQGNGVQSAFGEGMAAGDAPEGKPGASEEAETDEGYVSVFRAGGEVETLRGAEGVQDGREDGLVDSEGYTDGQGGFRIGLGGRHEEVCCLVCRIVC